MFASAKAMNKRIQRHVRVLSRLEVHFMFEQLRGRYQSDDMKKHESVIVGVRI